MVKTDADKEAAIAKATVEIQASPRQLCDVELIMNGGFSPLTGFMEEAEYKSVVENMELTDGTIFGLPVVFDTNDDDLMPGTTVLLKQGDLAIATVELTDKFVPDKPLECLKCYGTSEIEHPGALMVATERGKYYMGGKVTGLNFPVRDFPCKTPHEVRAELPADKDVVAFQCRNPIHRAHYELFTRALDDPLVGEGGIVLVHPTCGPTQADDIPGDVRYKTYEVLKEETANPRVFWEYLPYSMHMAGPREAIQHMIIRKNFGCTHFIIGRGTYHTKHRKTTTDLSWLVLTFFFVYQIWLVPSRLSPVKTTMVLTMPRTWPRPTLNDWVSPPFLLSTWSTPKRKTMSPPTTPRKRD